MVVIDTSLVVCSNCGSDSSDLIQDCKDFNYKTCENNFHFVRCRSCQQIYLKNRPLVKDLSLIYPEQHYVAYSSQKKGFLADIKAFFIKKKINPLLEYCKANDWIMEVGCASGDLIKLIKKFGNTTWNLFAVDISDKYFKELELLGVKAIKSRFEDLENLDSKFAVIIMNQVIEHLESPKAIVQKSHKLLVENGVLILETPSIDGLDLKIFKDKWEGWHAPRHWHMFDEHLISELLEKNGFEVLKIEYIFSPYIWIYSFKNYLEAKNINPKFLSFLSLNNFIVLSFVCMVDVFQKIFLSKTSNMRIIARKY
jgi:2-polyprenyl-3-methyl-5-hydroxy-6-metoxy-1,4-benzoquinol methylase